MRYDSFQGNVVKTGTIGKGKLIAMTEFSNSPYLALKKHGVAFIKDAVTIANDAYEKFMEYIDIFSNKFERSFITSVVGEAEASYWWNNITQQLPISNPNKGTENEFEMRSNILKLNPGMN